ncbi:cdc42 effector protein 1-like [Salmo trutta]|uniref:CDC42 effector protein (Rho GTPase binding) 1a n=1 Tax=Salmo trutta TaxID=8032 RepID=A0A674CGD6_SALTR|nr:cdc42 effector protein 1-like [Salmo trutta]
MNLGKIPGLKGLVAGSHGKRHFKGDLTLDMISPPLGDFRHTMHVGRGGDVFGDTSFLSNHGGAANGNEDDVSVTSPDNKIGAFFSRTLRHVRKTPEHPKGGSKDLSLPPPPISPIIKNAVSLPRLDVDGCPIKNLFHTPPTSLDETTYGYGLESGFVTLPRLSRSAERQSQQGGSNSCTPNTHGGSLTDVSALLSSSADPTLTSDPEHMIRFDSLSSMASFTFDLGPSLMSEVFGLIDSPNGHPEPSHTWEAEEAEEPSGFAFGFATNDGSEMDSEMDATTASLVDSLLREDCSSSRKSPYGMEWEEEEEEARRMKVNGGEQHLKGAVPDLVMGSPSRQRLTMESERFQGSADVLGVLYGVGGLLKGQQRMELEGKVTMCQTMKKTPYICITPDEEEEEEIKV